MRRGLIVALTLMAPMARAEVVVRVTQERVDVTATAAPLADVLDQLARQTGMEIVYDGKPPRQKVTLALQGRSAAEAVQGILEGQGLNYALVADPTGTRVQTLLLAGAAGTGTSIGSGAPRPPAPIRRRPVLPPGASPEMMDRGFDEMEDEDLYDDPGLMDEALLEDEPPLEDEDPLAPATAAPPPGSGALPFPGGQPRVYPASPFTPQPFSPSPAGAAPGAGQPETPPE